jgi:hypothetical protein
MSDRPYSDLSGEELRRKAKRADVDVAHQIARLRAHDELFREALDRSLALDDEIAARRNR